MTDFGLIPFPETDAGSNPNFPRPDLEVAKSVDSLRFADCMRGEEGGEREGGRSVGKGGGGASEGIGGGGASEGIGGGGASEGIGRGGTSEGICGESVDSAGGKSEGRGGGAPNGIEGVAEDGGGAKEKTVLFVVVVETFVKTVADLRFNFESAKDRTLKCVGLSDPEGDLSCAFAKFGTVAE